MFETQQNLFENPRTETGDICARRHRNNVQSIAANAKVNKSKDCAAVLEVIKTRGSSWSKEIGRIIGREIHTFSGRMSFLKQNGYIIATGAVIEGCAIYRWTGKN